MPGFTEIAYLRQPKGALVPSRITLGSAEGNGRMAFGYSVGGGVTPVTEFVETFGELATAFPETTPTINASFAVASIIYEFEGFRLDATEIWSDLVEAAPSYPPVRITIHDVLTDRDPVEDLTIMFSATDFNNIRPDSGTVVWGPDTGDQSDPDKSKRRDPATVAFNWSGSEASNLRDVRIAGYQASIFNDKTGDFILPSVPGVVESPIWCSVAPVFGDFAALAITGEDVLQSVASKSVTITTEYRPELEDLDNTFRYGSDSRGLPVIWRVLSTSRTERFIDLNLTAAAI